MSNTSLIDRISQGLSTSDKFGMIFDYVYFIILLLICERIFYELSESILSTIALKWVPPEIWEDKYQVEKAGVI